jgi:hypothetical protein
VAECPFAQVVTVTGGPVTVEVTVTVVVVGTVLVTVGVGTVVVTVVVSVAVTVVVNGGTAAVVETVGVSVAVAAVVAAGADVVGSELDGGLVVCVVRENGAAVWPGSTISAAAERPSRIPSATSKVAGWRYQGRRPVCRGVRPSKSGTKAGVASASARMSRRKDDMSGVTGIGLRAKAGVASASVRDRSTPSSGGAIPAAGMIYRSCGG